MAGGIGAELTLEGRAGIPFFFGEDQARYLLAVPAGEGETILAEAANASVPALVLGMTKGDALTLKTGTSITIAELRTAHEFWFPAFMAAEKPA